nr:MAG TPA: polynucleotide kinase [Caudoviricetes sp.]
MSKFILTQGIQSSGKTTFAKKWVEEDPIHRVRWNNDDCRRMCGPYWIPERESFITSIRHIFIHKAMVDKKDIIIDDMNLNTKTTDYYEKIVKIYNDQNTNKYVLEYKQFFDVSVDECIKRDSFRTNPVGEEVIRKTYKKYALYIRDCQNTKILDKMKEINSDKPSCVLVDLDGTLNYSLYRPWYGKDAAVQMINDKPNIGLVLLLQNLSKDIKIIIMSGRSKGDEANTSLAWLSKYNINYEQAIFRKEGDYRKGEVIKLENYNTYIKDKYNVIAVFEDDDKCIKMYKDLGLNVLKP